MNVDFISFRVKIAENVEKRPFLAVFCQYWSVLAIFEKKRLAGTHPTVVRSERTEWSSEIWTFFQNIEVVCIRELYT